jgi:hypothetical protein
MNHRTLALILIHFSLAYTATAYAETTNCTAITTLPYTIATQGVYCLTGNLSTSISAGGASAITINTNNVVLDLNGFKIGGLAAGTATQAIGINAYQRQNITIKNGTIRGFEVGILLDDSAPFTASQGHVIEDIRADQNTYAGIEVYGRDNVIRNNFVIMTGGSTAGASIGSYDVYAYGIFIEGSSNQVLNNMVTEVTAQGAGSGYGIMLSGPNIVAAYNRVSNITSPSGGSYGIIQNSGNDIIVSDNRLSSMQYGIYFYPGTTGSYMNNLVQGATAAAYTGGTAAGTTNY